MQRLGSCIFYWNPNRMDVPESEKTVASVPTYSGSAIFQWGLLLQGKRVTLEWDWMPISFFQQLRTLYQSTDTMEWNPDIGGTSFNVVVVSLESTYIDTVLHEQPYRQDVKMVLEIRSQASTTTTTTTSSTTTTTA